MTVQIIPAILVKSFAEFKEKISKIEKYAPVAQIDMMDGKFVSDTSFAEPEKIKTILTPCEYELHLMVGGPEKEIKRWLDFDKVQKIIFHFETTKNHEELIAEIKNAGKKVGLAINPETSAEKIRSWISKIDNVLVMGVSPGKSGKPLLSKTFDKIKRIRSFNKDIKIEVDGGVNSENAPLLIDAGANILVAGSFIFDGKNPELAIKKLHLRGVPARHRYAQALAGGHSAAPDMPDSSRGGRATSEVVHTVSQEIIRFRLHRSADAGMTYL